MRISVNAREFAVKVTNAKGETVGSVEYSDYAAELDLLGIIDAAGSVGEAIEALKRRALGEEPTE